VSDGPQFLDVFPIPISLSDTVNELKEAIQAKKPSFNNVDAESLRLWKVNYQFVLVCNSDFVW
jgi:hypothetical protein